MVYAPRGIGKTFFGLNVAYAVASGGSFLCWKAEAPCGLCTSTAKCPPSPCRSDLAAIVNSHEAEAEADALLIVTPDMQDGEPMPDLSTIEGQSRHSAPAGRRASDRGGQHQHTLQNRNRKRVR